MQKLSRLALGAALILPLALLPSAAWADGTGSSGTGSAADQQPGSEPTSSATPPSSSAAEPLPGTFTRTPASGLAGTKIDVTPVTKCVDAQGEVTKYAGVALFDTADLAQKIYDKSIDAHAVETAKDGSWSATLTTPGDAKEGTTYRIVAVCIPRPTNENATVVYTPQNFVITVAPPAPVATPVPKAPSFTG